MPPSNESLSAKASRRREWVFRFVAAVGAPLLLAGLLEAGLRVAGVGHLAGFFLKREIEGQEFWIQNDRFAERFFPKALARSPVSFAFPVEKPTNTVRIFVLGESAAQGDPLPRFGFARMLHRLLQERFPELRFEVINAAVTAINSHAILPIARDCAERAGDFWVVYMGNNEVVGPFGAGTAVGGRAPPLSVIRAQLAIKATRLGQAIEMLAANVRGDGQPEYWKGMELFAEQRVAFGDPRLATVYSQFRRNLEDILAAGTRAGASILLCTIAVNLRDCPPFASVHATTLSAEHESKWKSAFEAGAALEAEQKWDEAATRYREAETIDPGFAELQFRLARCLAALGRAVEAREHFQRALDCDALRFRADRAINRAIRDVGTAWQDQRVRLLDIEALTAQHSVDGIAGEPLFYEHVHFTPAGNYLVARAAAEEIARQIETSPEPGRAALRRSPVLDQSGAATAPPEPSAHRRDARPTSEGEAVDETGIEASPSQRERRGIGATRREWLSQRECAARLGYTEWDENRALRIVFDRMKFPPFTGTLDYTNRLQALQGRIDRSAAANSSEQARVQAERVLQAVRSYPNDWELREHAGVLLTLAQDFPRAAEELRTALRLMPYAASTYFSLAGVLVLQGRTDEAIQCYRECLRLKPGDFDVFMRLGVIELGRRRFKESIPHFRAALRAKPDSVGARVRLAAALLQERQPAEALQLLRDALRLDPSNAEAQELLRLATR